MSKFSAALVLGCVLQAGSCQDNKAETAAPAAGAAKAFLDRVRTPLTNLDTLKADYASFTEGLKELKPIDLGAIPTVAEVEAQLKDIKLPNVEGLEEIEQRFKELDFSNFESLNVESAVQDIIDAHPAAKFNEVVDSLKVENLPDIKAALEAVEFGEVEGLEEALAKVNVDQFEAALKETFSKPLWNPTKDELDASIREAVNDITETAVKFTGETDIDGAALLADMLKAVNPEEVVENIKSAVAEIDVRTPQIKELEDMTAVISPEIVQEAIEEMVADLTSMGSFVV